MRFFLIVGLIVMAGLALKFLTDSPADFSSGTAGMGQGGFIDEVAMTAYSSTPEQTDSTPFETASGTRVRFGVAACNWMPFGTQFMIPSLFGDKVFVVEDRMSSNYERHPRNSVGIDIWMHDTSEARRFGVKRTTIVLVNARVQPLPGGGGKIVLH